MDHSRSVRQRPSRASCPAWMNPIRRSLGSVVYGGAGWVCPPFSSRLRAGVLSRWPVQINLYAVLRKEPNWRGSNRAHRLKRIVGSSLPRETEGHARQICPHGDANACLPLLPKGREMRRPKVPPQECDRKNDHGVQKPSRRYQPIHPLVSAAVGTELPHSFRRIGSPNLLRFW
jgi:hypothetical protein